VGFALPAIWSVVEVNLCLVCASVPALKPLFAKYFVSLSDWTSTYTRRRTGDVELSGDPDKSFASQGWNKQKGVNKSQVTGGFSVANSSRRGDSFDRIIKYEPQDADGILKGTQVEVRYEAALPDAPRR